MPDGHHSIAPGIDDAPTVPCNLEAEQALLGALLVNNEVLEQVSGFLEPDQFMSPVHGRIYDTIRAMIARDGQADPIKLKPYFEDDSELSEVGGWAYLVRLANSRPRGRHY